MMGDELMKTIGIAAIWIAGVLAGCASTNAAPGQSATNTSTMPAHKPGAGEVGQMCPMQLPGTTVTSTNVEGGVALAFTTSTADPAALRQRVQRMAEMHGHHDAAGGMMAGHDADSRAAAGHEHGVGAGPGHGAGDHGGMMMGDGMMMPAATVSVEDIEGGARLVLRPEAPAQLEALREHVRTHVGRMARGNCPMMTSPGDEKQAPSPPGTGDADHKKHHPAPSGA